MKHSLNQTSKYQVNPNIEKLKPVNNVKNVVLKMFFKRLNGKLFKANFVKANGELRVLTGRTGVKKGVKGVSTRKEQEHLLGVYEMGIHEFRSINLNNLKYVKCGKVEIKL